MQTRQMPDSFTAMLKLSAQFATGACCALWRPGRRAQPPRAHLQAGAGEQRLLLRARWRIRRHECDRSERDQRADQFGIRSIVYVSGDGRLLRAAEVPRRGEM